MYTTDPTPFPDLNMVLWKLVTGVRKILSDNFTGAYLQGSFAVGDFDEDSDVDFLVVLRQDLTDSQLSQLQTLHARIFDWDIVWAKHLEGSYITRATLRCFDSTDELWYLDNCSNVLVRSHHDNTLVVRWVLREHGIPLAGPEPQKLLAPVPAKDLRQEVLSTMHDWAKQIFADPHQLNNRWYQPFAVLSYCRMLQTLHTGTVKSKPDGAQWAMQALDSKWVGLIQRAWEERPNPSLKVQQPANPDDFKSTFDFIDYALAKSRALTK